MEINERLIRRAAARGARSVTSRLQTVNDAADAAVARWEEAILTGKSVSNYVAWAFQVGRNTAKKLGKSSTPEAVAATKSMSETSKVCSTEQLSDSERGALRKVLMERRAELRGRQLEICMKLLEPGMSLHQAAKSLRMERYDLRRSFRSALVLCNREHG